MIVQFVRFTFAPRDADEAEAMLRELREASLKEQGVIAFEVARSRNAPNVFALWETYEDDAALDAHKATEHFKRLAINGVRALATERAGEIAVPI